VPARDGLLRLQRGSWALSLGMSSTLPAARLTEEVLFGHLVQSVLFSHFPLVPWFGVSLAGSAMGEWLGDMLLWRA